MSVPTAVVSAAVAQAAHGFVDSMSIQNTLGILTRDKKVLTSLGKCLTINIFLLLGSVYVHDNVLLPALNLLQDNVASFGDTDFTDVMFDLSRKGFTLIYTSCWLIPVWGLCYFLSLQWYQDIALEMSCKGSPSRPPSATDQMIKECYVLIAWLILYIFIQIVLLIIPGLSLIAVRVLEAVSYYFNEHKLVEPIIICLKVVVTTIYYASYVVGYMAQATCYGWYGFDYHWACAGDHYVTRFERVENHWPYFMGYGLMYVLIMSQTPFMIGFGIYLMLFPLTIILSSQSNYDVSGPTISIPPVRLFKVPGSIANRIIKFFVERTTNNSIFTSKKKTV